MKSPPRILMLALALAFLGRSQAHAGTITVNVDVDSSQIRGDTVLTTMLIPTPAFSLDGNTETIRFLFTEHEHIRAFSTVPPDGDIRLDVRFRAGTSNPSYQFSGVTGFLSDEFGNPIQGGTFDNAFIVGLRSASVIGQVLPEFDPVSELIFHDIHFTFDPVPRAAQVGPGDLHLTVQVLDNGNLAPAEFAVEPWEPVVPEPSSLAIFGIGALGLVAGGIRRRKRAA